MNPLNLLTFYRQDY